MFGAEARRPQPKPRMEGDIKNFEGLSLQPLIGDNNATFGQKRFNIPRAEAERMVQSDSMANDLRGEAMTVAWVGWLLHVASLGGHQSSRQPRLT
jgi:hypothetical protein